MVQHDFRISSSIATILTIAMPLLLYLFGFQNFIQLVSFVGGIFLAIEGLLIIAMWFSAKRFQPHHAPLLSRMPTFYVVCGIVLFSGIALYQIFSNIFSH